ncbi:hypothetical protein ACIQOW_16485 [Kitasatospora sp. NPDC091335]
MQHTILAVAQQPADGFAGWAADLVDTMAGPGAGRPRSVSRPPPWTGFRP